MKINLLIKYGVIWVLLIASMDAISQVDSISPSKNAVYVEILGPSVYWYNLSYDRIIASGGKHKLSVGLGIQFPAMGKIVEEYSSKSISPQINYLHGKTGNLEIGFGITFNLDYKEQIAFMRIGYRFQMKNQLFFKIAFTPFIMEGSSFPWFYPSGGLALGWGF